MDFRRLAGLDDPRVLSEAVTVIGWRKSQYSKEFWQELATRCAKEIVGKPVSLRIAFKKVAAGWGKSYHDIRKGKYDIELDPMWGDTMNAETTAHEIAHVRQYMSGMDLSDKAALEKDAVSYEPVGERVLKQMQAEGWKPRFEFPKEPGLLGKKLSDLTPDELEQAIAMMRAKKPKTEAVDPEVRAEVVFDGTRSTSIVARSTTDPRAVLGTLNVAWEASHPGAKPGGETQAVGVVDDVAVHSTATRRGVATRMYELAAQVAAKRGVALASSTARFPGSDGFWKKQAAKGRATAVKVGKNSFNVDPEKVRYYVLNYPPPKSLGEAVKPALADINATLTAAIKASDAEAEATVKAWTKAAPKKTCPRCQGAGIKANEIVVYAGTPGGCYQCNKKGVVPKDAKAAKATASEAELTRLRTNWKAYKAAAKAAAAVLAAAETAPDKSWAKWALDDYERQLKSIEAWAASVKP